MPALTPFVGFPIPLIDKITNLCCNLCQVASGCSFLLVLPAVWLSPECVVRWKVSAVFCVHHVPVNLGVHRCFLALHCFCKTTVNASSTPAHPIIELVFSDYNILYFSMPWFPALVCSPPIRIYCIVCVCACSVMYNSLQLHGL